MIFACNLRRGFACSWLPFGFGFWLFGCVGGFDLVVAVLFVSWCLWCFVVGFAAFWFFGYSVLGGLARYRFLAPGFVWWVLVF